MWVVIARASGACAHAGASTGQTASMGRKILFVTTDQQRYDALGCNGGTIARTPVVDGLAADGIVYRRAYNQNTVCMPARCTMLTGQYARTHGVVANGDPAARSTRRASPRTSQDAGRVPHRAHRQGALRARIRPQGPLGGERPMDAGRHRPVARLRPLDPGRARRVVQRAVDPALRPVARGRPPRAPRELRPAARRDPGRRHDGARDHSTTRSRARGTTPTGPPTARSSGSTRSTPTTTGSAGSASPTRTTRGIRPRRRCTGSTGATSTCRPVTPARPTRSARCSRRSRRTGSRGGRAGSSTPRAGR